MNSIRRGRFIDSRPRGMTLDSEILADLRQLLTEHGVTARWNGIDLLVLVSRIRRDQQIDLGGFVDSPDLSLRVPKTAFPGALPKFGERIEVDGDGIPDRPGFQPPALAAPHPQPLHHR